MKGQEIMRKLREKGKRNMKEEGMRKKERRVVYITVRGSEDRRERKVTTTKRLDEELREMKKGKIA